MNQYTRDIRTDLQTLGVREGGALLVHSSLRSLEMTSSDPAVVIDALLRAVGPQGTLLIPALSYKTVNSTSPLFSVASSPSCVGAIAEYFRVRSGTRRSLHPTHSVCGAGPQAAALLDKHILDDTPCGPNSPFRLLRDCGGQILFLGCGLLPNTSMHAVEEIVNPPYLFSPARVTFEIDSETAEPARRSYRCHGFAGYIQRYDRIADLLAPEALHQGRVLAADCYLLEAQPMWATAVEALRTNPFYFVDNAEEPPST